MAAIVLVSCVAAVASPSSKKVTVPDVVGLDLNAAEARLQPNLKATSVDASGQGRMQLVDGNWHVISQDPAAGASVSKGATVTLKVLKASEPVAPTASSTATAVPSSSAPSLTTSSTPPSAVTSPAPAAAPTTLRANPPQGGSSPSTNNPPPVNDPPPANNNAPPANDPPPSTQSAPAEVHYANCSEVRAAGKAPLYRGQPGYTEGSRGLDRDSDGVACE